MNDRYYARVVALENPTARTRSFTGFVMDSAARVASGDRVVEIVACNSPTVKQRVIDDTDAAVQRWNSGETK